MPVNPADKAFLGHFPPNDRGPVMNQFLAAPRTNVLMVPAIIQVVMADCIDRIDRAIAQEDGYALAKQARLLRWFAADMTGAKTLATYCVAYCALPEEEREQVKAEAQRHGFAEVAATKPASEKQLKFIRVLGGDPATVHNMAEASALIERLKPAQS